MVGLCFLKICSACCVENELEGVRMNARTPLKELMSLP